MLARLSKKKFFEVFYPPKVEPVLPAKTERHWGTRAPLAASVVLLLAAGIAGASVTGRQEIVPERLAFATFPVDLGTWQGRPSLLEPQVEHFLFLTDYILSDYHRGDGRWVNFYVAYYASQRKGASPHSPSVCIPGSGWQITKFERTSHRDDVLGLTLPFNRVVIERESHKQIVYYWFVQRGRRIENEWVSKWHLLTDAIFMNRTDGALVRLTTMIYPGESEQDADRRLQSFFRELEPRLAAYLPSENQSEVRSSQNLPVGSQS